MTQDPRTIAIVGGGATGTIAALALLRHPSTAPRRVLVLEPARRLGAGVAYGTDDLAHLLNVRTLGMSAVADEPSDFLAWARRGGGSASGPEFLPRARFADYLRDALSAAAVAAPTGVTLEHVRRTVRDVRPAADGATHIDLDGAPSVRADAVLLATGHRLTVPAWLPHDPRVILDPWRPGAVEALVASPSIAILGSGLTAVDVLLSLRQRGHTGRVSLISRHGLLPASHRPDVLPPRPSAVVPGDPAARTARGLLRALREDAWTADDWRQTIDALRPQTVQLWRDLPDVERRRALRHASRFWEVRRHRMAPEVAAVVDDLAEAGRLHRERGRVTGIAPLPGTLRVTLEHAGASRDLDAGAVISCIGPSADPADDPLLCRLIGAGTVVRHPLGMGLDVITDGRVRAADGRAWPAIWAMGPLRKGAEWESTAVPEIRLHARDVAVSLLGAW